jgi:RHS repeat-associated protein
MVRNDVTYRLICDHLGSVRTVVNVATGAVVQRLDYDAWGRVAYDSNPGFQPFAYAGGMYEAMSGLTRFGTRDYDARIGRWTARDPWLDPAFGQAAYVYVSNDPLNFIDQTGLVKKPPGSQPPGGDDPLYQRLKQIWGDFIKGRISKQEAEKAATKVMTEAVSDAAKVNLRTYWKIMKRGWGACFIVFMFLIDAAEANPPEVDQPPPDTPPDTTRLPGPIRIQPIP